MDSGMVPEELVQAWQVVYGEYLSVAQSPAATWAAQTELARSSAGVAAAWRDIVATPGLTWWLVAALTSAAEAFERQAQEWGSNASTRPTEHTGGRLADGWFRSPDSDDSGYRE